MEKSEGAIKNGQSRDTENVGYTKTEGAKKESSNTDPTKKPKMNLGAHEG